ncbi:MAG: amidohydrolase family protein [Chloroflexota bacterium]|nr:amidohydrolase family protein [Chloroflexota bacterium]
MKGQFKVIDTTRHVIEPVDLWDTWLEEPFKTQRPIKMDSSRVSMTVKGRPVSRNPNNFLVNPAYQQVFRDAYAANFSGQSHLSDMDKEGVDVGILLPTAGMYAIWSDHIDAPLAAAMARAYNNYLADYCKTDKTRLKGIALLPLQNIEESVIELRRAVKDLGFVAAFMRSNPVVHRLLHNTDYDPLYQEALDLGVPIVVSEATGSVLPELGVDRYPNDKFSHEAVSHTFELWVAMMSFFGHNVLERFPGLKVGFLGAGAGWLPFWIDRLEEHWGEIPFGHDCPSTLPPDYLFKRQGFAASAPWEAGTKEIFDEVGDNVVVWGSQYPWPMLSSFPDELDNFIVDSNLTDEQKMKVLWDNAASIFGIE